MLAQNQYVEYGLTTASVSAMGHAIASQQEEVKDLAQQLTRDYAVYAQTCQAVLAQHQDMTLADFKALEFIMTLGPLPVGQLAQLTGLSYGGITALISRLENAGLIKRDRHPLDRRVVAISIDEEGCANLTFPMMMMQKTLARVAQRYSMCELAIIKDFLLTCGKQLHSFSLQQLENAGSA